MKRSVAPRALGTGRWPKAVTPLTDEQRAISDDFMDVWLEAVGKKPLFRLFDAFNHGYPVRHRPRSFVTTLEVGGGSGRHLAYERLSSEQRSGYVALELRESLADRYRREHPEVTVRQGDCQERLPFADGYFDRIVATHVLEHLPRLPQAVAELHRVCNKERGELSIVIPCEGSFANNLARRISSQRMFERRYGQPFAWFIESEHVNLPWEILAALRPYFRRINREFFPIPLPISSLNFCIGSTFRARSLGR